MNRRCLTVSLFSAMLRFFGGVSLCRLPCRVFLHKLPFLGKMHASSGNRIGSDLRSATNPGRAPLDDPRSFASKLTIVSIRLNVAVVRLGVHENAPRVRMRRGRPTLEGAKRHR